MEFTLKEIEMILQSLKSSSGSIKTGEWEFADKIYGEHDQKHGTHKTSELQQERLAKNKRYKAINALIEKIESSVLAVKVEEGR